MLSETVDGGRWLVPLGQSHFTGPTSCNESEMQQRNLECKIEIHIRVVNSVAMYQSALGHWRDPHKTFNAQDSLLIPDMIGIFNNVYDIQYDT